VPSSDLDRLAAEPYVSVTTVKRDGTRVPTPVWAAPDGEGHLVVWTGAQSGKVKRLRHTPAVTVAPCDRRGKVTGDAVPGTARLLPDADLPRIDAAMARKYGVPYRLTTLVTRLGRPLGLNKGQVGIEITLG
jgi:PPOX class probable F420-dependent enzyme